MIVWFEDGSMSTMAYFHQAYVLAHSVEDTVVVIGRPIPPLKKEEIRLTVPLKYRVIQSVNNSNFRNIFYPNKLFYKGKTTETLPDKYQNSNISHPAFIEKTILEIRAIINPTKDKMVTPRVPIFKDVLDFLEKEVFK